MNERNGVKGEGFGRDLLCHRFSISNRGTPSNTISFLILIWA